MTDNIDFIVTWVDGNDPEWRKEKNKAKGIDEGDSRDARYRDWDTLKYWFRGVEKFAPWVNKVFFVTCGHYPEWLDLDCPKLTFVKHDDFIPKKYLPTFSCRPIEFNLHRIPGLSERFVYFNDDMFLLNKVEPTDFFVDGLPCDSAILDCQSPNAGGKNGEKLDLQEVYSSLFFNTAVINRNFDKKKAIAQNKLKWFNYRYGKNALRTLMLMPWRLFTGFKSDHLPYSYLKSTYNEVWSSEYDVLDTACSHKFRINTDVSSRLLSFWQIAEGKIFPRSPKIGYQMYICNDESNNSRVFDMIRHQRRKIICVNDEYTGLDFETVKAQWIDSFETILSDKSVFER